MTTFDIKPIVLTLFDGDLNTNVTTDLSPEMKIFYSDYLIDKAEAELIHDQFAQKHPIPKNGGKTVEFRQYSKLEALPEDLKLQEGVTPDGQELKVSTISATVEQYGGYVTLSDMLMLTAIDNNLVQATELIASQAGRTLDTITRNYLASNANALNESDPYATLTVKDVQRAVRALKRQDAPKINGYYVGIIHPDVAYDLMRDPEWVNVKDYDPDDWYEGEIGKIAGVRFVETTTAFYEADEQGNPTEYTTLILGANAYGVTEIEGGGLQHFVKQLGSAGTADPLNQRATVGWKATRAVEILVPEYMIAIETYSEFINNDSE
ncbi:MAG: N4-gp56 family major capsid protein [Oscillospiraceae bacterium]|nr:N4-gp56 family major capsid protein [Oscillospiraceae bacterium]